MLRTLDISTSGLVAQRQRMDTIAGNIANVNTTRDADGKASPFQRRLVALSASTQPTGTGAVGVDSQVELDEQSPMRDVYQPDHPDADKAGYVHYPNVNLMTEFVNAIEASRAYDANVNTIDVTKGFFTETLKIVA